MIHKISRLSILVIGIVLLLLATPAVAGGWVVITLDGLPGEIRAGETARLGFTVRQHGVRPVNDVSPVLTAVHRDTGETIRGEAEQVGDTGHFEVAVHFPQEGVWEWQLTAPPFPQEVTFEPLAVLPAVAGDSGRAPGTGRLLLRWVGAGLLALAAVTALLERRRRRDLVATRAPV